MARFQTKRVYDCFGKLLPWNRCGLWFKPSRKNFSQVDDHLDIVESEIYCPFVNHSKAVDQNAVSSFLSSPLSVQYANKIQRNGHRIYLDKFHSVTSILKHTRPASEYFALKNWKKSQISEIGEEQFKKNKKSTFNRGILFHHVVQLHFTNSTVPYAEGGSPDSGYWNSVSHVLKDITNVIAVESAVVHPLLGYAGTLDLIAEYKGKLSVIDWKTSAKHKTNLKDCYSYPQQVAAYAGAVNFDDNYPFQVCDGVIVIAYENGDPADIHHMSPEICEKYWLEWLMRLQQFRRAFPQHVTTDTDLEVNKTGQEMNQGHKIDKVTEFVRTKPVNSIGVPVASLGRVIRDEDILDEEPEDDVRYLSSKERFHSLHAWLAAFKSPDVWKKLWHDILQLVRFGRKSQ